LTGRAAYFDTNTRITEHEASALDGKLQNQNGILRTAFGAGTGKHFNEN
jgi:hypothetical protein